MIQTRPEGIKTHIQSLLKTEAITPSVNSPIGSMPKTDKNEWYLTVDYCKLNVMVLMVKMLVPSNIKIIDSIQSTIEEIFCFIDLGKVQCLFQYYLWCNLPSSLEGYNKHLLSCSWSTLTALLPNTIFTSKMLTAFNFSQEYRYITHLKILGWGAGHARKSNRITYDEGFGSYSISWPKDWVQPHGQSINQSITCTSGSLNKKSGHWSSGEFPGLAILCIYCYILILGR